MSIKSLPTDSRLTDKDIIPFGAAVWFHDPNEPKDKILSKWRPGLYMGPSHTTPHASIIMETDETFIVMSTINHRCRMMAVNANNDMARPAEDEVRALLQR